MSVVRAMLGAFPVWIALRVMGLGFYRQLEYWWGPLVWWPGLILGFFFVTYRSFDRAACFVWLPGPLWLAWGVLGEATAWRPAGISAMVHVRIGLFPMSLSDRSACSPSECLGQLFYTYPALNAVTYSIGAALAFLFKADDKAIKQAPGECTTLKLD